MIADNKDYIQWFTANDEIQTNSLDTERVYEAEISEDIMNIKIYTPEEQEENFQVAIARLEKHSNNYSELAKVSQDIMAASKSAQAVGDFLFSYNKETKKNKSSEFWDKYRELKQVHVNNAIAEIKDLLKGEERVFMLIKIKNAAKAIHCLRGDVGASIRAEAQTKIDSLMAVA